jgi:uncharacterized protein YjdB
MKKLLVITLILVGNFLQAQLNESVFINKERCGADKLHKELLDSDPNVRQAMDYFENVIMPIARNNADRQLNVVYQVPVVVHVVHKGEAVGVGSNISDADVKLGIKYLNNFWRKIAGTFGAGGGVDMQIEFALAVRDPNGNCTNGIVRKDLSANTAYVSSGVKLSSTTGISDATLKSSSRWNPLNYYNVYVVDEIDNKKCNDPNGWTAGYAYFASSHGNTTDGAVMLNCSYLDASDVTFAHEMGHAFNLYHTFEGDRDTNADGIYESCPTNTAGTACGSGVGDCCADIPAHVRTIDIPNLYNDCGNTTSNPCVAGTTRQDHMLNYMDYTGCANEFTANQQTRAVAALTSQRSSFLQSNGNLSLVPPAVATVDFYSSSNVACTGSTIQFTDNSGCTPNSYTNNGFPGVSFAWTITNNAGTTLTSTLQNPVITFNTVGTYDVTLAITNASGTTSFTRAGYIRVAASPVTACIPTSINVGNFGQTVFNVKLNTINNTTSQYSNTAYSDFSCSSNTILTESQTYALSVSGYAGNGQAEVFEVRIDYNNNGSFLDVGELVHSGSIAVGTTNTVTANITIPTTAVRNTLLRMRVIGEYQAISTNERNCNASSDRFEVGDVEDYGVYIISTCTTPTITGTLSACVGATSQLTGSGTAATTNAWASSSPNVATVSATGLVTALTVGTTTITYLNNAGCSTTATFSVTAGPTITGTLSACIGSTSQLTGSGTAATSNAWTSSATSIATVSTTGLVTAVAAGTTTITYLNNAGCSSTVTFTVSSNPTISGTLSACVGSSSILTGSGTPGTNAWTSSATNIATVSASGTVLGVAPGTTIITYRNSAGCTTTATFTVTAGPTITGTLSACVGATSQLTGSGTAATTGPWTSSATSIATVSSTGLVTAVASGTAIITYKNNAGCTTTATFTVSAGPTITGTLSACISATSQLTGSGTAATSNAWTSSTPNVATVSTTGLVTAVSAGTTTITYLNNAGCSSTVTFTVNANPTITGTLSACVGGSTLLTGSGTPGTNAWTSSATNIATVSASGTVLGVAAGTTIITYRNSAGCTTTATFTVTAGPTITGTLSACVGATSQLTGSGTAATTGPWTSSATSIATVSSTGLVTAVASGTAIITYKNNAGCTTTATFTVSAGPTITGTLSACISATSQLTGSGTASTTNAWTSSSPNVATVSTTGLVTAVAAGTTTITYLNNAGCSSTVTFTVNANPTITGTLSACVGGSTLLTGSGTPGTNAWTSSATNIATVSASGTVLGVAAGTTIITYRNSAGCTTTATFTVYATPTINSIASQSVCSGQTVASTNFTSSPTGATFSWTNSNTANGIQSSGTGNISSFTAPQTNTIINSQITVTATLNNCISTPVTFSLNINPNPVITNSINTTIACGTAAASLIPTSSVSGTTFSWTTQTSGATLTGYTANGTGPINQTITNSGNAPGTVVYTIIPNSNGCVGASVNYSVTVNPIPNANFSVASNTICFNQSPISLTPNQSGGSFSGTGVNQNTFSPSLSGVGTFTVSYLISQNNCTNSSTQTITVNALDNANFSIIDFCFGNAGQATISGVQGGTFSLIPNTNGETISSNGTITGGVAGTTYTVTYTTPAGGCQNNSTDVVTVFALPNVPVINLLNDTLRTTTNASSYLWYYNGTTTGVTTSYYVPGSLSGNYQVVITDVNGCSNSSNAFSYQFTAIKNINGENLTAIVYPNPANEKLFIALSNSIDHFEFKLTDLIGREILHLYSESIHVTNHVSTINLPHVESAVYFYEIILNDKERINGKLVIQN